MSDFGSGYGQAKADALALVKEAIQTVDLALHDHVFIKELTDEKRKELSSKRAALKWVQDLLKPLKTPR